RALVPIIEGPRRGAATGVMVRPTLLAEPRCSQPRVPCLSWRRLSRPSRTARAEHDPAGGSMAGRASPGNAARAPTEWLCAELPKLTPENWQTPQACGAWGVADVAAHLIWVADLYRDAIGRALADDVGPPTELVVPESPTVMHARIAEIAFAYRREL